MPEGRKSTFTFERRQVVLGLAGLMGAALTGCSFDGMNASTLQPTPSTTSQSTTALTSKVARGTTLYVCQKHTEQVDDIAWSPDSAYIISASNGIYSQVGKGKPSQLYVWNSRTGEPNETFSINQSSAMPAPLAWSPDGKMIAICELPDAGGNDWVNFWDTQSGKSLGTYEGRSESQFHQLTWSPDSSRLAIAGNRGVEICDASTRQKILSYPASLLTQPQLSKVVTWSPDGNTIASAAAKDGHSLQFWNAHTGEPLHYFAGSKPDVAAWSPDGKMIAVGAASTPPQVLDVHTGQVLLTCQTNLVSFGSSLFSSLHPHTISWSPDSAYIAVANDQAQVQIWNVAKQQLAYTYTEHRSLVSAVAWSPDGSRIASASYDKTVHVWQAV